VEELYRAVRKQTEALHVDWEIVFVNQGQCEMTWLATQRLVRKDAGHVRVFQQTDDQCRSSALALGYREAKGDLVFTIESDQQDDPSEISRFLARIEWESNVFQSGERNDAQQRWQNILPRGVLRAA
jgi:glycosyltransferase involved in cell wall biosynthesis